MDAVSPTDEWRLLRTAKSCGPDTPTLVSTLAGFLQADGGKKARFTRESTKEVVQPSRRECRLPASSVVTPLACFFHSHARLWIAVEQSGIPCALYFLGRVV